MRIFLVGVAVSAILSGELKAAEIDFLKLPEPPQHGSSQQTGAQRNPDDPAHYNRRGQVKMKAGVLASSQAVMPGDLLKISLFADKPYRIIVDAQEQDRLGGHKIIGRVEGSPYQTFIMSTDAEDFVISLQDLSSGKTYFISGKTATGQGSVLEVDDRKKPRRIQ